MSMVDKEKIKQIFVYDKNNEPLVFSKIFMFPKELFKNKNQFAVTVKCSSLPAIKKGEFIIVVFEYVNGTRIRCETRVDNATRIQLDFHAGEGKELEERRGSFKITVNDKAFITAVERNYNTVQLEEEIKVKIVNINLGGVLMKTDTPYEAGDVVVLQMFDEEPVELRTKILRKQLDPNGNLTGYGCQFMDITQQEEERVARYIFEWQVTERERRINAQYA